MDTKRKWKLAEKIVVVNIGFFLLFLGLLFKRLEINFIFGGQTIKLIVAAGLGAIIFIFLGFFFIFDFLLQFKGDNNGNRD